MNTETREIKMWADLTEEEKASGKWVRLEEGIATLAGAAEGPVFNSLPGDRSFGAELERMNSLQRRLHGVKEPA